MPNLLCVHFRVHNDEWKEASLRTEVLHGLIGGRISASNYFHMQS